MSDLCTTCGRGPEACEYCAGLAQIDYETICDCGLRDFGYHLVDCSERKDKQWIVAESYESAGEPKKDTRFHPTCPRCEARCSPDASHCAECGTWLFYDPPGKDGKPRKPGPKRGPRTGVRAW